MNNILHISAYNYLIVSILLFFIGTIGFLLSKNLIKIFISFEFIINSINLLFITFSNYKQNFNYFGNTIVLFITALSVLIIVVGLYFTNKIYRLFGTINIDEISKKYRRIKS